MRLFWTQNGAELSLNCINANDALLTDVIVSLFTDRRALSSDILPSGNDRRGWWGDSFNDRPIGSRLWLLSREKQLPAVLGRCEEYADESLAWLVKSNRVRSIGCQASIAENNTLLLIVIITLNDGSVVPHQFNASLNEV